MITRPFHVLRIQGNKLVIQFIDSDHLTYTEIHRDYKIFDCLGVTIKPPLIERGRLYRACSDIHRLLHLQQMTTDKHFYQPKLRLGNLYKMCRPSGQTFVSKLVEQPKGVSFLLSDGSYLPIDKLHLDNRLLEQVND